MKSSSCMIWSRSLQNSWRADMNFHYFSTTSQALLAFIQDSAAPNAPRYSIPGRWGCSWSTGKLSWECCLYQCSHADLYDCQMGFWSHWRVGPAPKKIPLSTWLYFQLLYTSSITECWRSMTEFWGVVELCNLKPKRAQPFICMNPSQERYVGLPSNTEVQSLHQCAWRQLHTHPLSSNPHLCSQERGQLFTLLQYLQCNDDDSTVFLPISAAFLPQNVKEPKLCVIDIDISASEQQALCSTLDMEVDRSPELKRWHVSMQKPMRCLSWTLSMMYLRCHILPPTMLPTELIFSRTIVTPCQ